MNLEFSQHMEKNLIAQNPKGHVLSSADFNKNVVSKPVKESDSDLTWKFNKACNFFLAYKILTGGQDLELIMWFYNKESFLECIQKDLPISDVQTLGRKIKIWADSLTEKINQIERNFENGEIDEDYYEYDPEFYVTSTMDGRPEAVAGYAYTGNFLELQEVAKQLNDLLDSMLDLGLIAEELIGGFEAGIA